MRVYVELLAAFFSADLAQERRERLVNSAKGRTDDDSIAIRMSHSEWILATRQRFALTGQWRALFDDIDVILCPAMPTPAFAHDHAPIDERMLDIDGRTVPYGDQIAWATIAILNGLPATTLPIGRTSDGLPIGAQIVGGFLQDRTTIALAELIEREFGGFTPPPNL